MSRKTYKASLVALAATLGLTFASAEGFGAQAQQNAQQGENSPVEAAELTEETVPVFVQQEVVQPLPEPAEDAVAETAMPEANSASSLKELISMTPTSGQLSREMECLAGAIYFEARGEPIKGQLAVGQVVVNRAASSTFPDSYCGVVFQRSQFSFVRGGRMPRIARNTTAWTRAKALAKIAHEGLWESGARDSLYFHANYVSPSWARRKQSRITIARHQFYR